MQQNNTNHPLDLTCLQDLRFVKGHIGKGSYGLVRLAYRQTSTSTTTTTNTQQSSNQLSTQPLNTVVTPTIQNSYDPCDDPQQLFAVKLFDRTKMAELRAENTLRNEADILKHISSHQNIISYHSVVEDPSVYGIVTEYASGGDLLHLVKTHKRLSECQAKPLFQQIVSGVSHAHRNLVIHRDLKPENVFLTNDLTVKIGDWGLASRFHPKNTINEACGSVHYSSPEMVLGRNYVGPEVDVWSLGVMLFAITTGTLPFYGNHDDIKVSICRGNYQCPSYLSDGLVQLIGWMLQPNPLMRCEVGDLLEHPWLKGVPGISRLESYERVNCVECPLSSTTSCLSYFSLDLSCESSQEEKKKFLTKKGYFAIRRVLMRALRSAGVCVGNSGRVRQRK